MKIRKTMALAAMLAGIAYSHNAYALNTDAEAVSLRLQFVDSKNFTDIDLGHGSHAKQAERVMKHISKAFQGVSDKYLPSGYTMEVQVTDISLAGDRSPMSSTFGEIRVYRDMYPPRIKFNYAVYDAQENLVTSGKANETNLSYTNTFRGARNFSAEEAPYVTDLIRTWASRTLPKEVKVASKQ